MSTKIFTGQLERESLSSTPSKMGVASPSTKRRLEAPEGDEIVSAKIAKKQHTSDLIEPDGQDTTGNENSSDFLTTSILARTLLTSSTPTACYALTSDPLESLKSSLEALPAPAALDSLITNGDLRPTFISLSKTTILQNDPTDLEFTSLMCHERPLGSISSSMERTITTVLSPIDEWNPRKSSLNGGGLNNGSGGTHQVITEDENGKSYFNLGSADATIVARKTIPGDMSWANNYQNNNNNNNHANNHCSNNSNNSNDFDDNASSSSCESISSEDLFNSGEEFDGSDDDEEELCSYKQQRSTVLHLSLCKLNKFRSQQCVEPSLHRSVLICNTLRHIEQEIKNEDEVDESLKSREKLPSFWRSSSNNHCFSSNGSSNHSSQPQITDSRPGSISNSNNTNPNSPLNGHDPYLSPSPYNEPAYLSYDYNSLRPTPYHTTTYEYEHDLPNPVQNGNSSNNNSNNNVSTSSISISNSQSPLLADVASSVATTLLECDSGYGEDLDLSSYYYGGPLTIPPVGSSTPLSQPPTTISSISTSSQSLTDNGSSNNNSSMSSVNNATSNETSYLHCGFSSSMDMDMSMDSGCGSGGSLSPPSDTESSMLVVDALNNMGKSDMGDNPSEIKSTRPSSLSSSIVSTSLTVTSQPSSTSLSMTSISISPPSACDYHIINGSSSGNNHQEDQMCWSTSTTSSKMSTSLSMKEPTSSILTSPPSPTTALSTSSSSVSFAQQDSQCGIESRRSDLSHGNHFNNLNLPMDSLISSAYSSSL